MNEFKSYKIDDVSNYVNRGVSPTYVENSGIIIINQKCIRNGKVDFSFSKLTSAYKKYTNEKKIVEDDILINSTGVGTAGRVSIFKHNFDCYVDTHVSILRLNNQKAYPKYVFYNLFNRENEIENYAEGSTGQIELGRDKIKDIDILLPSLPEQKAIASVLSSLDDKIDLLHRQNETLEKMAETLFRKWFVEDAKEDWVIGKVSDFAIHFKESVQPQKLKSTIFYHYSLPSFDNQQNPVEEIGINIQSNKYKVPFNCFLFSKLNPNKDKRVWLILDDVIENSICSTEFQVVLPKKQEYLYFLYGWLTLKENYNEISSGVGGTSGSHQRIDPKTIFEFMCPQIPFDLIKKFNLNIEPVFNKINRNRSQIKSLTKMRDTLLSKLMSGEVRVKLD